VDFFRETIFRPLGGAAPSNFYTLEIDQALLAHTPRWDGVTQEHFNGQNIKFGHKFRVLRSITSRLEGVSSQTFIQSTSRKAGVITWVQFLQGPPPKICDGKKSSKIWHNFWQLSTLIANISGTEQYIENWKSSWKSTTPPMVEEKKLVYFGL